MSQESVLFQLSKAGTLAIPKLSKTLTQIKKVRLDKSSNELPIQLKLGDEFIHHGIFICPVTRELSEQDNPPMLLKCGHCISK